MKAMKDPLQVIQSSRPADSMLKHLQQQQFILLVQQMLPKEFGFFCKKILKLQEFYDWNCLGWATDKVELTYGKEQYCWQRGR
jgi:hypothetical protein